jgi:hypothetical protein
VLKGATIGLTVASGQARFRSLYSLALCVKDLKACWLQNGNITVFKVNECIGNLTQGECV